MGAYEIAAIVANSQNRNEESLQLYDNALKIAEEIYGEDDKRTTDYKSKIQEMSKHVPTKAKDKSVSKVEAEPTHADYGNKITKESIIATPYGTFNGIRMKLIVVDYIKGKSLKIFGMKKDGTFAKSLCLPYTVFQIYFQVEGKVVTPQDIKNENVLQW